MSLKTTFFCLLCFVFFVSNGQNQPFQINVDTLPGSTIAEKYSSVFSSLNTSSLTNGLLLEKSLPYVDLIGYRGLSGGDTCTQGNWAFLYKQVVEAAPVTQSLQLPTLDELREQISPYQNKQKISIGLLYMQYDKFRKQEVNEQSNFFWDNGKLKDSEVQVNPYIKENLLAVASMFPTCKLENTFVLPSSWWITNDPNTLTSFLEIDFADGKGFQRVDRNQDIKVDYKKPGIKTWKIRFITSSGVLLSNSNIMAVHSAKDEFFKDNTPDLSDWEDPGHGGGNARIFLRDSHNGRLSRPVIFTEGYDLFNEYGNDNIALYSILNNGSNTTDGLLRRLNQEGYDVVILDFNQDYTSTVQNYAGVIERLLDWVNNTKEGAEELVLAGASMGGVASRYILSSMEQVCHEHYVRLYISYDAPHQGVNVPISLQLLTDQAMRRTYGLVADISMAWTTINSTSFRQMANHHFRDGVEPRQEYTDFYEDLHDLNMPQRCRNVAITNGSTFTDRHQSLSTSYGADERILQWTREVNTENHETGYSIDAYCNSISPSENLGVAYMKITRLVHLFDDTYMIIPVENKTLDYGRTGNDDYRPGGYINTQEDVAEALVNSPFKGETNTLGRNDHCIVEVNSSLDIKSPENATTLLNKTGAQLVADQLTPFDAVYIRDIDTNFHHVSSISGTTFIDAIVNEILTPTSPLIVPRILTGEFNFTPEIDPYLHTVKVTSGGKLFVNANKKSGFDAGNFPATGSTFSTEIENCGVTGSVTVGNGGQLILGDNSTGNIAKITVKLGAALVFENGSKTILNGQSEIIVEPGAYVSIHPGASFEFSGANAKITLNTSPDYNTYTGAITFSGPGEIILNNALFALSGNQNITLKNGSTFTIGASTYFEFRNGASLNISDANSVFNIEGHLLIRPTNFTYSYTGTAGKIRFNSDNPSFLQANTGSKITIPPGGLLEVLKDSRIDIYTNGTPFLYEFNCTDANITISTGKKLVVASPRVMVVGSNISGGGTLSLFRTSPYTTFTDVRNSTFDHTILDNAPGYYQDPLEPRIQLLVDNCDFINAAKINDLNTYGVKVQNSRFKGSSSVNAKGSLASEVRNCTFDESPLGGYAITATNLFVPMVITNNRISTYTVGITTTNAEVALGCNVAMQNQTGLKHTNLSRAIMNGAVYGRNNFSDNHTSNINFSFGRKIDLTGGNNLLYNTHPGVPGGKIMSGNYFGENCNVAYYIATGNQWTTQNIPPLARPQNLPAYRFDLSGTEPVTCDDCDVSVIDNAPVLHNNCEIMLPDDILGGDIVNIGIPIVVKALSYATFAGGTDDKMALELFRQVLISNYTTRDADLYCQLTTAYMYAKKTAATLIISGDEEFVKAKMGDIFENFDPETFAGSSVADVYQMAIDEAMFDKFLGDLQGALDQLQALLDEVQEDIENSLENYIAIVENEIRVVEDIIGIDVYDDVMDELKGVDPTDPTFDCEDIFGPLPGLVHNPVANEKTSSIAGNSSLNGLAIYPVPSTGTIYFSTGNSETDLAVVKNLLGQEVHSQKIKGDATLNLSHLPKGIYVIECRNENERMHQQKIVLD